MSTLDNPQIPEELEKLSQLSTKVFIPNKGAHDYSDAERYGKLFYVTKGEQSKNAVGKMARRWAQVLQDSAPNDHIMITSLTTLTSIGCALFAAKHGGKLNLLLYKDSRYISRKMELSQLLEREGGEFDGDET